MQPPVTQRVAVKVSPEKLVLKEGATASVEVRFVGGSPQFREGARLDLRTNTGTIENLTAMGEGAYTALYRAPEADVPQVAILTAVDGRDPTRTYGHVTLPLTAPKDLEVESEPDAKVMVKVGAREFGPVPTDRRGRATVPVVIPPGWPPAPSSPSRTTAAPSPTSTSSCRPGRGWSSSATTPASRATAPSTCRFGWPWSAPTAARTPPQT